MMFLSSTGDSSDSDDDDLAVDVSGLIKHFSFDFFMCFGGSVISFSVLLWTLTCSTLVTHFRRDWYLLGLLTYHNL